MATEEIIEDEIVSFQRDSFRVALIGTTGLYFNRMSKKARETLLMGGRRDKVTEMKHDMVAEFRDSPYIDRDEAAPTLLKMPAGAFKSAIADVTLDMGTKYPRTKIERLVRIVDDVSIYGIPYLRADVVRSADAKKTPDIRSRAFLPTWCASVTVEYVTPALKRLELTTLFVNAGLTIGVGDGRQQKGARDHGLWELTAEDNPEFERIVSAGGRAAQQAAMDAAVPYDADTEELLTYFHNAARAWVAEKSSGTTKVKKTKIAATKSANGEARADA